MDVIALGGSTVIVVQASESPTYVEIDDEGCNVEDYVFEFMQMNVGGNPESPTSLMELFDSFFASAIADGFDPDQIADEVGAWMNSFADAARDES